MYVGSGRACITKTEALMATKQHTSARGGEHTQSQPLINGAAEYKNRPAGLTQQNHTSSRQPCPRLVLHTLKTLTVAEARLRPIQKDAQDIPRRAPSMLKQNKKAAAKRATRRSGAF